MEKKFEFLTKIYVQGMSKKPLIRRIAKIIFILYLLIFAFIIAMEGFSFSIITANALPLVLLLYVMGQTAPVDQYKNIIVNVELDNNMIEIKYDGLDRNDKMGPRIEKSIIEYKNITRLEYSKPLECLNIQGYPIESTQYLKQSSKKEFITNFKEKNREKRTLLYVRGKEKNEIVRELENKTGLKVIELN